MSTSSAASSSASVSLSSVRLLTVEVSDLRWPTSDEKIGSDPVHHDPDYSCAYVTLHTNHATLKGFGLTFTLGRGTEVVTAAIQAMAHKVEGRVLGEITQNFGGFWHSLVNESQLRWLGPEKGVIHLATAALVNAIWDLWARIEQKPLWRLLADLTPEQWVSAIDFRWISDFVSKEEALAILKANVSKRAERIEYIKSHGYPCYTTSAGWLGFSDEKLTALCREAKAAGFTHFKVKVGVSVEDDKRRLSIIRREVGADAVVMVDANQRWDVSVAVEYMKELQQFNLLFIEEPTSPDDVLGHAKIRSELKSIGIKVATGEAVQNRVIFKQMLQAQAIDFLQIDACRVGGINELLAIMLMATKANVPIYPHAGGVGLCELVQHLIMADYVAVSGKLNICEFVDHLHEHFVYPVKVVNGHYLAPQDANCGYSAEIKASSIEAHKFPNGSVWLQKRSKAAAESKTESLTVNPSSYSDVYLITGAYGFLAAYTIKQLLRDLSSHVLIVATDVKNDERLWKQILSAGEITSPNIVREYGDITDSKFVSGLFTRYLPTHVIHFAGVQVPTCRANPALGSRVNVSGTINVFEGAVAIKPRVKSIIYASSAAVCSPGVRYGDRPVLDDELHTPTTQYGVFKLCNEGNARIYWQDHQIPSVGLRPLTVFGVGREIGLTSSPTKAMKAAVIGRSTYEISFNGSTSFNDAVDVANLFVLCSRKCTKNATACNITGQVSTVENFMDLVRKSLVEKHGESSICKFQFAKNAVPIPFPSQFDESNLKHVLGLDSVPVTPLQQSIENCIQHFERLKNEGILDEQDL